MYCRYGYDIGPYLEYMDEVRGCVKSRRAIFGMDANAASPLWFSKDEGRSRENEMRGRILEEWVIANGMIVLNEPSEFYTFSGVRGESDVDVTLMCGNMPGCRFKWQMMNDWSISDHNVILTRMMSETMNDSELNVWKRWVCKDTSWEDYESEMREIAGAKGRDVYCEMNVDRMAECMTEWIQEVHERTYQNKSSGGRKN